MSFKAFVWAWDQDVENASHQHVLLALADIAPVRDVFASAGYIAKKIRRSERHVRSALDALAALGIITITPRPGRVDIIHLNIPKGFQVVMDDDGDLEAGERGRPKNPCKHDEKPLQSTQKPPPLFAAETIEEPIRGTLEANASCPPAADRSPAALAFDAYNEFAKALGKPLAMKLNDQRRRSLNARLKECGGLAGWQSALERAGASPFLRGDTHHRFVISIDFLLQPASFTKLTEGKYDGERQSAGSARSSERLDTFTQAAYELAQERRERG